MVRMRIFDERMMKMQRTGKLSFYMRSLGEEAVAIAQTMALETQDWIFPTYRQPGAQFVRGRDDYMHRPPMIRNRLRSTMPLKFVSSSPSSNWSPSVLLFRGSEAHEQSRSQ